MTSEGDQFKEDSMPYQLSHISYFTIITNITNVIKNSIKIKQAVKKQEFTKYEVSNAPSLSSYIHESPLL